MELSDVQINTLTQWCRHSAMTKLMHIKGQKALARNVADEFKSRMVNERKDSRRKREVEADASAGEVTITLPPVGTDVRGKLSAERPPDEAIIEDPDELKEKAIDEMMAEEEKAAAEDEAEAKAIDYGAVSADADRLEAVVKISNQAEGDPTQDRLSELLAVINRETPNVDRGADKVDQQDDNGGASGAKERDQTGT